MEANLFIKNAEVEGNKIKNIEFYGDWQLNMGGSSAPKYVFADGKLVEDAEIEDDPFISIVPHSSYFTVTVNFLTDAYLLNLRGKNNSYGETFASSYVLIAGYNGVKISAGQSLSFRVNLSSITTNGFATFILITDKALVKTYKLSKPYLESLL